MNFNERLRDLRKEQAFSQEELAKKIDSTNKNIWAYENNYSQPNFEMLIKLADVFDVTVDYLIGRTDDFGFRASTPPEEYSKAEKELVSLFRLLGPYERETVLIQIKALTVKEKV